METHTKWIVAALIVLFVVGAMYAGKAAVDRYRVSMAQARV